MAVSDRSNPSLARFWGFVLAVMFYGFVMAGLLGLPARKTGEPLPGPAGTGPAQVAGVSHPQSEASASAPTVTPTEEASKAQPNPGAAPPAAAPPSPQAKAATIVGAAKPVPAGNGPSEVAGVVHPQSEASASAPMVTSTEEVADAQPNSGATPLATAAPPPQVTTPQVPTTATTAKPIPADNGGAQAAGVPPSRSEASASAPTVAPTDKAADAQPNSGATLVAAAPASPEASITQVPTIAVSAKPIPPAAPRLAWANIRHYCSDGEWTWDSRACRAPPRRIVWRWVLRGCAIRLGNVCIGPSYAPHQASERRVWR